MTVVWVAAAILGSAQSDVGSVLLNASLIEPSMRKLELRIDRTILKRAIDAVWREQANPQQAPWLNMTPKDVGQKSKLIAEKTEDILKTKYSIQVSKSLHDLLLAEALVAWVTLWVTRNTEIDEKLARGEHVDTVGSASPQITFSSNPPKAVCAGYSLVLRNAARDLGLRAEVCQGRLRDLSGNEGGHCWAIIEVGESVWLPADTTTPVTRQEVLRQGGKVKPFGLLPRSRDELTIYHARYFNWSPTPSTIAMYGDDAASKKLSSLTEQEWRRLNVSSLRILETDLYRKSDL